MSSDSIELLKMGVSFVGGAVGAGITNILLTRWIARKELRLMQRQTRWLPLLEAAQELEARFSDLQHKYRHPKQDEVWKVVKAEGDRGERKLPTWARDFHELYTLNEDPDRIEPIEHFDRANVDPDAPRREEGKEPVRRVVRLRMRRPLNYATGTLYLTVRYLSYARRVQRDLNAGRLVPQTCGASTQDRLLGLLYLLRRRLVPQTRNASTQDISLRLKKVQEELHGTSPGHEGSGILREQQDSIGENVWGIDNNNIISYSEFEGRLLRSPDWETFRDMFRFFIEVDLKLDTEVEKTKQELGKLCEALKAMLRVP